MCRQRGYTYAGRQWLGKCFCGDEGDNYKRGGRAKGCDCHGTNVGGKKCVYQINTALTESMTSRNVFRQVQVSASTDSPLLTSLHTIELLTDHIPCVWFEVSQKLQFQEK